MASKTFHIIIDKMRAIHDSKNADYANDPNPLANFERAKELISWFNSDEDKTFAGIIGIKLARLAELLSSGKKPNNESIDDTFIDLANYVILWAAFRIDKQPLNQLKRKMD
jgi:hypothetical protein